MITLPLNSMQYSALASRINQEQGVVIVGRSGTISKYGVTASYTYDGTNLVVTITKKPMFMTTAFCESKLLAYLTGRAPQVNTSLAGVIALVLCGSLTLGLCGCTDQQQAKVKDTVARIGAEIPKFQPLITAAAGVADLVLPSEAVLITGVTATVEAGLTTLAALCNTYAANPTDSVWQSIVSLVEQLEQQGATGILDAAHITNPTSRALAQSALGALQTLLLIIDGYVQQARTPAANAAAAHARLIKLREIAPLLDRSDRDQVEEATGHSFPVVFAYESALGF